MVVVAFVELRPVKQANSTDFSEVLGRLFIWFEFPFGTSWDRFHLPSSYSQRKASRCLPLTSSSLTTGMSAWNPRRLSMLFHGCSSLSEQRRHSPYSIQFESRLGSAAKQKRRELAIGVNTRYHPLHLWGAFESETVTSDMTSSIQRKDHVQTESKAAFVLLSPWFVSSGTLLCSHTFSLFFSLWHSLIALRLLLLHFVYTSCLTCFSSLPIPPFGFLSICFCLYFVSFLLNLLCSFSPDRSSIFTSIFLFLCSLSSLLVRNVCGNWSSFLLTVPLSGSPPGACCADCPKAACTIILSLGRQDSSHPLWLLSDFRKSPSDWSSLCSFSSFIGSVSEPFSLLLCPWQGGSSPLSVLLHFCFPYILRSNITLYVIPFLSFLLMIISFLYGLTDSVLYKRNILELQQSSGAFHMRTLSSS